MPPKRRIPTAKRPATGRRTVRVAANAPLYTAEEKHRMIQAHAAMREPHDPVQLMSAWAGVAVTLLVVAVGWWWAAGSGLFTSTGSIGKDIGQTFSDVSAAAAEGKKMAENNDIVKMLGEASDKLQTQQAEAAVRQQALDHIANLVNGTGATNTVSGRADMFLPSPATSTKTPKP